MSVVIRERNSFFATFVLVESVQTNIFTEKVVFRLNITCKTIFILSLALSQFQDKEMGKKNCRKS